MPFSLIWDGFEKCTSFEKVSVAVHRITFRTMKQNKCRKMLRSRQVASSQEKLNAEKAAALRRQGWVRGHASGAGFNCLIHSLLQLLAECGVVVMPLDREAACAAVRDELMRTPGAEPISQV